MALSDNAISQNFNWYPYLVYLMTAFAICLFSFHAAKHPFFFYLPASYEGNNTL